MGFVVYYLGIHLLILEAQAWKDIGQPMRLRPHPTTKLSQTWFLVLWGSNRSGALKPEAKFETVSDLFSESETTQSNLSFPYRTRLPPPSLPPSLPSFLPSLPPSFPPSLSPPLPLPQPQLLMTKLMAVSQPAIPTAPVKLGSRAVNPAQLSLTSQQQQPDQASQ